jgi:hypothetical protein
MDNNKEVIIIYLEVLHTITFDICQNQAQSCFYRAKTTDKKSKSQKP